MKASVEALAKVTAYWLAHEPERLAKTTAAQQWAVQNYGSTTAFFRDTTELYYEVVGRPPFGDASPAGSVPSEGGGGLAGSSAALSSLSLVADAAEEAAHSNSDHPERA